MIVVSNRIQVAEGHEKEFEARFEGRARLVEHMPGFIRLEILRPLKSDYYVVLTHWQDEASFGAWTDSAEFKEAHRNRPRAEILAGPNVFEMHEVIQRAEKNG
jgi:heme-degrading monooxygenase HmoA